MSKKPIFPDWFFCYNIFIEFFKARGVGAVAQQATLLATVKLTRYQLLCWIENRIILQSVFFSEKQNV